MKFKDLDQQLLKLYNGDLWAFPDFKQIYSLYERIKGKEVQKPILKKQKFKEMISALQEYISNVPRYVTDLDQVFPFQVGLYHSIFEQNIKNFDFNFRPLLSDRITFEEYILKYCQPSSDEIVDEPSSENPEEGTNTIIEEACQEPLYPEGFKEGTQSEGELKELKNQFNSMDLKDVESFFSELKSPFKNNAPILTEDQFRIFIKRSFCGDIVLDRPNINLPHGAPMATVKLFHGYYQRCRRESWDQKSKNDYLNLLKDAFNTKAFSEVRVERFDQGVSKHPWKILK